MNDGLANSGAALSRSTQSNAWVPLAQWFAVLTMTLEHVTKYVWPESAFVPWALAIGRIAFPVFAGMVAWHLLHNTRRPVRYGLRLLLIGAISQVPYAWVVTPDRLNICFTLAFGLLAVVLLDQVKDRRTRMATGVVLFLLAAVVSPFVEYQILGLLLVPAFVYAFRNHQRVTAMLPALALCAVINGGSPPFTDIQVVRTNSCSPPIRTAVALHTDITAPRLVGYSPSPLSIVDLAST